MADFMKVIFIQLTDEAGEVAMFEVLRENCLGEFLVLIWSSVSQQLSIRKSRDDLTGL